MCLPAGGGEEGRVGGGRGLREEMNSNRKTREERIVMSHEWRKGVREGRGGD